MEGLEISAVRFSKVTSGTSTRRFDPEYFQKQHLADEALIAGRDKEFQSFATLKVRVDGSAFYPAIEDFYGTGDLPFLRVADVDAVIDFEKCTRIPSELCNRFPTLSRVYPGDLVFTKGGSVARIGLVTQEAAASRDLIFLNTSKLPRTQQVFLFLFSQTALFNRMLLRSSSQTAQPHLTITLVRELPSFRASEKLKQKCVEIVDGAFAAREKSIATLREAEDALTAALGLKDWQPPEPLTYTRRASDALGSRRLDAEYFAPRVLELLEHLGKGGLTVRDVAPSRREPFAPARAGTFDYIEIGSVHSDGTAGSAEIDQADAPSRANQFARAEDVITSTVRPIRRLSAIITPEQAGFVCSSGFAVLQPLAVASEVLLTYLRLPLVCELMDLHTSASLYPAISETDLLKLPFPKIPAKAGERIVAAVRSAHTARRRARALLAAAQRAVEVAIEQSEAAGMAVLNSIAR